jgi:hypothetical protein
MRDKPGLLHLYRMLEDCESYLKADFILTKEQLAHCMTQFQSIGMQ